MREAFMFVYGVFATTILDAFWRAPDYYRYGDITRTEEVLWMIVPIVLLCITFAIHAHLENKGLT